MAKDVEDTHLGNPTPLELGHIQLPRPLRLIDDKPQREHARVMLELRGDDLHANGGGGGGALRAFPGEALAGPNPGFRGL